MSDRHEWLDEALRLAAGEDARTVVPANVETRVMRAWDDRHAGGAAVAGHGARRAVWIPAAAAAAACALGLLVLPPPGGLQPETRPGDGASAPKHEAGRTADGAAATAVGAASGTPVATGAPQAITPGRAHAPTRSGTLRREIRSPANLETRDFVLVPEPPIDTTALQVVRVRMSRMAFASLGVPIEYPEADGLMEVEMIVGDDGVARSIRRAAFVSVVDERGER